MSGEGVVFVFGGRYIFVLLLSGHQGFGRWQGVFVLGGRINLVLVCIVFVSSGRYVFVFGGVVFVLGVSCNASGGRIVWYGGEAVTA